MASTDRVTYHGRRMNVHTRAALMAAEDDLGYDLTVVQGSYNRGVGASAGTHDRGGVLDLLASDAPRKIRALRANGFIAWVRTRSQGFDMTHIHAVLINGADLAPSAQRQVASYKRGKNGLAREADDSGPKVVPFAWPPKPRSVDVEDHWRTITVPTYARETPSIHGKKVARLKRGETRVFSHKLTHDNGAVWLRTREGNWVLGKRTRHGKGLR